MNPSAENLPDPETADASDSDQAASSTASSLPDGRRAESPSNLIQLGEAGLYNPAKRAPELVSQNSTPMELVAWGLKRFADQKIVITTSFGMEGCTLIDMCSKAIAAEPSGEPAKLTVAWIDTGFFFPETHALREKLAAKYDNIEFVRWSTDVSVEQQAEAYGNELWKNNPNLCCHIRKVVPMKENVGAFDLWMTGLRRSQTESRAQTPVMAWDWKYHLLKFCPLASWTRADVWQYVQQYEVPFNQLHLQNYPSISCFHCTRSVPGSTPDSDARDGRWEGKDKDECGLHFSI